MAQVDDELATRKMLTEMTADQPPAPPARYLAVRRRAVAHRRRQLAGVAAAVAVLATGAIAIPLGLVHIGPQPPTGPSRRYHMSQYRPGPGQHGLVGIGWADGVHWRLYVQEQQSLICMTQDPGDSRDCTNGPPAGASRSGDPLSIIGGGADPQVDVGTVRSDVAYLTVTYNNGQVLTIYPVAVFPHRYARYVALAAPYGAAVTQITAYSSRGELAYAIPFTGDGGITPVRWLRPGQAALPSPARYLAGSGRVDGKSWHAYASIGPWGICFTGIAGATICTEVTGWTPSHGTSAPVRQIGSSGAGYPFEVVYGAARTAVAYVTVTTSRGGTVRVPVVSAGSTKLFAYASANSDPIVRWAAYDAAGHELGSGRPPS